MCKTEGCENWLGPLCGNPKFWQSHQEHLSMEGEMRTSSLPLNSNAPKIMKLDDTA